MSSIASQRGFGLRSYPTSFGFVLVKAAIEEVSSKLSEVVSGTLRQDVHENFGQIQADRWLLVWQYAGHSWTIFNYPVCKEDVPKTLSKTLETNCIYF